MHRLLLIIIICFLGVLSIARAQESGSKDAIKLFDSQRLSLLWANSGYHFKLTEMAEPKRCFSLEVTGCKFVTDSLFSYFIDTLFYALQHFVLKDTLAPAKCVRVVASSGTENDVRGWYGFKKDSQAISADKSCSVIARLYRRSGEVEVHHRVHAIYYHFKMSPNEFVGCQLRKAFRSLVAASLAWPLRNVQSNDWLIYAKFDCGQKMCQYIFNKRMRYLGHLEIKRAIKRALK